MDGGGHHERIWQPQASPVIGSQVSGSLGQLPGDRLNVGGQISQKVVDQPYGGSACSISIGTGLGDSAPGSLKGLQLVVSDIEAARAELVERGVEVSEIQHFDDGVAADGPGGDWNSFIFFNDPDGNAWTVQQKPAGDSNR